METSERKGGEQSWGLAHLLISATSTIPAIGLVVMAALVIVYIMRVFVISTNRAREFVIVAVYAGMFFSLRLINPIPWDSVFICSRVACFLLTLIFLRVMHSWRPVSTALRLPGKSKNFWRRKR